MNPVPAAGRTDRGLVRDHNEDVLLVRPPLYVVADGMGGHRAGEVAAAIAVEQLGAELDAGRIVDGVSLGAALLVAGAEVRARGTGDRAGMGTTVVAILLDGSRAWVAHVGDSRAYLLRAGTLEQLTADHTLVGELVRRGRLTPAQAATDTRRHVLTRALGASDDAPDVRALPLAPGDRLLLCSDGLAGVVPDARIGSLLGQGDPEAAADALVAAALAAGGPDNVTVIALDPPVAGLT